MWSVSSMKLGGTYPNLVGAHQGGGNSGWILLHWAASTAAAISTLVRSPA